MAFVKKTWKDRIVQYANRRLLTKSGGEVEQVTVTRDEGTISEAGDQFNASNMNDLEQRVKDGFDGLNASDIEYSSGVTVKQAIDTLKTTTTGTCTVNATNCNSGNVSYAKSGNVITVGGYIYTKGTWSSTATPIFELPYKPLIDLNPTAQTVISGDNYKTTYLNVSSSFFNVRLDNSVENNQLLRFGFSYVANV